MASPLVPVFTFFHVAPQSPDLKRPLYPVPSHTVAGSNGSTVTVTVSPVNPPELGSLNTTGAMLVASHVPGAGRAEHEPTLVTTTVATPDAVESAWLRATTWYVPALAGAV